MEVSEPFTVEEQHLLEDKTIFNLKKNVTAKLSSLFGTLCNNLEESVTELKDILPVEVTESRGKISKGENYLGFPWMILDYPRIFRQTDVFAFRSLCWWAHEYSFTLHLSGNYFHSIRQLQDKLATLRNHDLYICISDTPWSYHFREDNYILLDDYLERVKMKTLTGEMQFLKLSRRIGLKDTDKVVNAGVSAFTQLAGTLYMDQRLPSN